ncbi:REP-associated tyrosine transposase [Craterilacuibacter sinensis]|uniref:Transposase n=1 Tax=Craterilacuibacter sinensis TaxID=2686017 RepID=A0A845BI34_9NEIS|nr:transposase [Craterilacuibacter sinensis]MXR35955.1 transposase [Craterilacuibacter sinensis]
MPDYRRLWRPGGTYFFTVTLLERHDNRLLVEHIDLLRAAVSKVKQDYPFTIHAWVVLPEHLHCVIELPEGDADFATRWRLIKSSFSRALPQGETRSASRLKHGERGIWQRRYWEHLIRDENDFVRHVDYVHYNPVKHGWVERVSDWPYSTFHRHVTQGFYPADWGDAPDEDIGGPD